MKQVLLLLALSAQLMLNAQVEVELPNIVPLSPDAASIAKYGEIPVSYFTGVPNIAIPIHNISSGELYLPLLLSYHAGGNKVESIASWVGLGWSLSSIPSISRSVRGIADDVGGGYFTDYGGYTVQDIGELDPNSSIVNQFRAELFAGTADSEPDIFYYNLPEESGKFFYNQESTTFITYPRSNTKIQKEGDNFKIISQEGLEYILDVIETTQANGTQPIKSTWYASKMISPTKKDTIHFTYRDENQLTKTRNVVTKYHYLGGISGGLPSDEGSIQNINTTYAKLIESITFKNGQVLFNQKSSEREDLQGGYGLDNISIYNNSQLIDKYEFVSRYVSGNGGAYAGTPCYNVDNYTRKWMFLDKISRVSPATSEALEHEFVYDETYSPPCRNSAAQDYWGYFNGEVFNQDLTPTYYLPNIDPPIQITAADRGIDPIKSKFGILERITYPAKGYTEFDFENNMAYANDIQVQYDEDQVILAGDEFFIDPNQSIPIVNSFEMTFTINNPPDSFLNNNNSDGGSNTRFTIEFPGCDISQNANNCARFTVQGMTNSYPITDIFNSNDNPPYDRALFLPNGTYKLTASFDQSPPQYQDFIFIAEWDIVNITQTDNKYVGGLRIKEMRNYPSISALQPIVKKYKYTTDYISTLSSGDVFGSPNFSHSDEMIYYSGTTNGGNSATSLLRVRSTSNMQQVTHSGSSVGYQKVFEETNNTSETGYTEYQFSNTRDLSNENFPYPPGTSKEVDRGKLLEQKNYKKIDGGFELTQKKSLEYTSDPFTFSGNIKYSLGLKWGNNVIYNAGLVSIETAQVLAYYSTIVDWKSISKEIITTYHENDSIKKTTNHFYDNSNHLFTTRTETVDSNEKLLISKVEYPEDISNPSAAIQGLISQNRLREVIRTATYSDDDDDDGIADANELLGAQENEYRIWAPDIILPEKIKTQKGTNIQDRIVFYDYDDFGNPLEVSKESGPSISYIWGYNKEYPIAKMENFESSQITTTVQNLINAAVTASDNDDSVSDENTLRTALSNLRNTSALSDAMVTTYTYDPLVGVTSMTDPKGYTIYYEYDEFNRLEFVKDA
ncbi:MAG: hypothetical protein ABJN84_16735, partial [Flavobacteriaceae bacterium]